MAKKLKTRVKKAIRKWQKYANKAYERKRFKAKFYLFAKRQNTKTRVVGHWQRRSSFYLTILYFLIAVAVASFSQLLFPDVVAQSAADFFNSAGAMTGGTLAILFSFNTLLVSSALAQYPPQFFRLSGYDKKQDLIYFFVAVITVSLFILGFMYQAPGSSGNYWILFTGLLDVFTVFYLIFLSYSLTRRRLNPIASIGFITRPAFKLLEQSQKNAKRLATLPHKDPTLKPDKAYIADLQPHVLLQARYDQLNEFIGYLYDYHDKLVDKKDYSAALNVLEAIGSLIIRYIDVRKDSFVMLPSDYILVPITDAQKFFDTNFQRMVDRSKTYISLGNQNGLRKVLDLFEGIGLKLRELTFPKVKYENPPFDQCVAYLGYVCDEAIKQKDLEATFQLARIYGVFGTVAVNKDYLHTPSTVFDALLKLAMYAGTQQQNVVTDQIAQAFDSIAQSFKQLPRAAQRNQFKTFMDKLGEFYWYYVVFYRTSTDFQANTTAYMVQPLRTVVGMMNELAKVGSGKDAASRDTAQHDTTEIAHQLWRLLRTLSDKKGVSLSGRYFGTQLTDVIEDACYILISSAHKIAWQRHQSEALKQASWLLNQIAFLSDNAPDKMDSHQLDELSNKAANISLYALHKGDIDLAKSGINVIKHLALVCLNKSAKSAEYDAPRIMANTGLLAVLALQQGNTEVVDHYKLAAAEFNAAYNAKFFPDGPITAPGGHDYIGPHPDQLNDELATISRQLVERRSDGLMAAMLELPEDYLVKLAPDTSPEHFNTILGNVEAPPDETPA